MDLFVYGTLRAAALMEAVAGAGAQSAAPATLADYAVLPLAGNVVPFIRAQPGATAPGVLWGGLDAAQIARLDLYEGAFGYRRAPVTVRLAGKDMTAQCYLPPAGLQAAAGAWSLAAWEADHLAPACHAAAELFAHNPLPEPTALRAMWPMIEARAWARHRAEPAPAARRHNPAADDVTLGTGHAPQGQFFRLQRVDLRHRRFDGTTTDTLRREVFLGCDAAIVLPYDPQRDKVLLVEQVRIGAYMRNDPNPWMLEPVAGIIDARETPAKAALRETAEEAGLTDIALHEAGGLYPSPGGSSDYFYCYIGLCDLPLTAPYLGGLDAEGEDLRLHPLSFDAALALADSGEVQTGPALYLLHWLLRHRDRLRAGFA